MKDRDHVLKLAVKNSQNGVNRLRFVSLKIKKKLENLEPTFFITALNSARGNSKMIWNHIKKMTGNHDTNKYKPKEIISNGISLTKPKLIAEAFNNYFMDSVDEISKVLHQI